MKMVDNQEKRRWLAVACALFFSTVCMFLFAWLLGVKYSHMSFLGCGVILLLVQHFIKKKNIRDAVCFSAVFILLSSVLYLNFQTNIFSPTNSLFLDFQADSESFVLNAVQSAANGTYRWDDFGLLFPNGQSYTSQIGLQGKLFSLLVNIFPYAQTVIAARMLCCIFTAATFVGIVFLMKQKYNGVLAGCFYITFLLSPWIVNFSRNLYWVVFTWFLPMLFGLLCSLYWNSKKHRVFCYIGVFVSILIKSACGYEYISTIMLAMITFLVVDFVKILLAKDKKNALLLFRTIFILGLCAVLGFIVSFLIHAHMRGDGNLLLGIENIYKYDVQRRMLVEADASVFGNEQITNSMTASVVSVIRMYFAFYTEVLAGIPGGLFFVLSVLPLAVFVDCFIKRKPFVKQFVLYGMFFCAPLSWFVLAKPHSYIHTHMNYVLWYFGFVQICLYVVINYIKSMLKVREGVQNEPFDF